MKKYIIGMLIIVFFIVLCFYFVFSRDENLTITYIKVSSVSEFVIGINNNDKVVMYNPLSEEAGVFNLGMFNNKDLKDVSKIFINELIDNNYLINNNVNLTIMTKNLEKKERIYKIITKAIFEQDSSVVINVLEPTSDELVAFSNEEVFDIEPVLNENDLIIIGNDINDKIDLYMKNKINALKLDKSPLNEHKKIIEDNYNLGYFNDFVITNLSVSYNIIISKRSFYQIEFIFNEDLTYSYNIMLDLEFDYYNMVMEDDTRIGEVSVYKYRFDSLQKDSILDYQNHFYRFNY